MLLLPLCAYCPEAFQSLCLLRSFASLLPGYAHLHNRYVCSSPRCILPLPPLLNYEKALDKKAHQNVPSQSTVLLPLPRSSLLLLSGFFQHLRCFLYPPILFLPETAVPDHNSGTQSTDRWYCQKTGTLPGPGFLRPHRYIVHSCCSSISEHSWYLNIPIGSYDTLRVIQRAAGERYLTVHPASHQTLP